MEIEGQHAQQWLSHLVGEEYLQNNPNLIYSIPLIRKSRGSFYLAFDNEWDILTKHQLDGDLFVFDEVAEGEEIAVGYIDPERTVTALEPICERIINNPAEALFAYSCLNRRLVLHNCAKWELRPFTSTLVTGAFMAGELTSVNGKCRYSNMTFSVSSLSESTDAAVNPNLEALADRSSLQFDNLPLIAYLFSSANSELENEINENKQKLAEQMVTDPETGLPNLTGYIYDSQDGKFNALCLLALKNESVIRVFLDKKKYASYLKTAADTCKHFFGGAYEVYRHGELSMIIAAKVTNKDVFISNMKRLKGYLADMNFEGSYRPIYEMGIAFGEDNLLKRAELTVVNVHKGSGDILVYSLEDNLNFKKEFALLQIINDAITHKRVIPYYQGTRNNKTKKIDIYESLMRIADKDGRIYYPGDFLPVAKEYKLYDQLSQMMIEKVLEDSAKHTFSVTVNLNTSDLYNQNILHIIFSKLKTLKHPERLIFEIVESEGIDDYGYLKTFTDKIHGLGGKIAVDDFGTGYSNLIHLLRIDLDYIKITGDIVKEVKTDSSCRDFINMISTWANSRNKKVIAEFVENKDIQKIIRRNKVAYSQGYLFSKPQPID